MKKFIFALMILIMWALPLSAETYNSPFGFSIDIPSHWFVLSKEEIKDNPELFNTEREELKDMNKDYLSQAKSMVASGQVEVYFNKKTSNLFHTDNITALKVIDQLPQTISEQNQICAMFPQKLSEMYGKPAKVYECKFKKTAGLDSLYVIGDGPIEGIRCIQYHIQKSPSVVIVLTAGAKIETFEIIKEEFEKMLSTLIMHLTP